ncbi:acid stress response protein YqgB [Siccibacter turicensis]|uniref:acid stress response protein YqgB n=2 Tax=Siccibacter turicensis TaxID=357233 RepID=UPI00101F7028
MNMKPVAQSAFQRYVLESRTVYGLLSQLWAAIVVNCFTPVVFRDAEATSAFCALESRGYTLSTIIEVRYV